jgi:hypothetical protein
MPGGTRTLLGRAVGWLTGRDQGHSNRPILNLAHGPGPNLNSINFSIDPN